MRPILTADEYRRVDKAYTGDLSVAMDHAGYAVALAAARAGAIYGKKVVVLAGPGNNGGDGYVAARYLSQRGASVEILALAKPKTPEAIAAAALAVSAGVRVRPLGHLEEADVVIDAVFGGGGRSDLPSHVVEWMDTPAPVVAVDFPTGLDPNTGEVEDTAFHAFSTVTFQTLKTGHMRGEGPDYCGAVVVADIGIEGGRPCMWLAEESDAPRPQRARESHKWSAGAVMVVGGSTGMTGAAVFAGRSALHFGAGSVVVGSPRSDVVTSLAPELPTFDPKEAEARLDRFDVVIAGPGLAEGDQSIVEPILRKASRIVLDAGGLTPELVDASVDGGAEVIVTPHAREFERIAGVGGGAYSVRALATDKGVVVLLKGNPTLISDGSEPVLVDTGGPELASIGTGDVLSGMVGALWARGLDALSAAISAAYWHGVAGADLALRETVTADEMSRHVGGFAW